MSNIKCPECGKVFTVSKSDWNTIAEQVRDDEFAKAVQNEVAVKSQQYEKEIIKLQTALNTKEQEVAWRAKEHYEGKIHELEKLNNALESKNREANQEKELAVIKENENLKNKYEKMISEKDVEIGLLNGEVERLKNYHLSQNTKELGESLEQWCYRQFRDNQGLFGKNAEFKKDNDSIKGIDETGALEKKGTKGDFIFRDYLDDGTELLSIMFEMKDEFDTSVNKKKNADHYKKLNADRVKKHCEYAILVSTLEKDDAYYNRGLVDVSLEAKCEKIYVIRPDFFVPVLTFLHNMARNNAEAKQKLAEQTQENLDIQAFWDVLNSSKESFNEKCRWAKNNFTNAINDIDRTIKILEGIKESFRKSGKQFQQAADTLDGLTVKKLTNGSPIMERKFAEAGIDDRQLPEVSFE